MFFSFFKYKWYQIAQSLSYREYRWNYITHGETNLYCYSMFCFLLNHGKAQPFFLSETSGLTIESDNSAKKGVFLFTLSLGFIDIFSQNGNPSFCGTLKIKRLCFFSLYLWLLKLFLLVSLFLSLSVLVLCENQITEISQLRLLVLYKFNFLKLDNSCDFILKRAIFSEMKWKFIAYFGTSKTNLVIMSLLYLGSQVFRFIFQSTPFIYICF